jgi:O-antigen/teichoic acid export membrane protein
MIDSGTIHVGIFIFTWFLLAPFIAIVIGYAAWKGKPKSFDREMYWTVSAAAMAASVIIVFYVSRHDDSPLFFAGLLAGGVLFGVSTGFGIGTLTRRKNTLPPFNG